LPTTHYVGSQVRFETCQKVLTLVSNTFDWNRDLRNRDSEFSDRRSTAADAKAALLQAYWAAQEAAEPTREARQAERLAIAEARESRRAEREQVKFDEQKRIAAEAAERDAAIAAEAAAIAAQARAEIEARETANKNRVARVLADEATRKAERDRRYANRKARQA
jgi:hypothetical protein